MSDRAVHSIVWVVLLGVIGAIIWLAATATDANAEACTASGGIVNSSTKAGWGFDMKGKYVQTWSTLHTCIKDGAVTNVW
jgi:hypothetical protein